jgi:hypothetical protein
MLGRYLVFLALNSLGLNVFEDFLVKINVGIAIL